MISKIINKILLKKIIPIKSSKNILKNYQN